MGRFVRRAGANTEGGGSVEGHGLIQSGPRLLSSHGKASRTADGDTPRSSQTTTVDSLKRAGTYRRRDLLLSVERADRTSKQQARKQHSGSALRDRQTRTDARY